MLLGDPDTVVLMLRAMKDSVVSTDHETRIASAQVAVTSFIEERTGRTFVEEPSEEAISVSAPYRYGIVNRYGASPFLILPKAITAITSVKYGVTWDGAGWTGGTTVPATEYRPAMLTNSGEAMALESIDGSSWAGNYVVTGLFESEFDEAPADITYVANLLIAELFKYEQSSAAALAGPDGQTLRLKESSKHPVVAAILDKYTVSDNDIVI